MTADLRTDGLIATIPVAELDRARAFYEDVLGFEHVATSEAISEPWRGSAEVGLE